MTTPEAKPEATVNSNHSNSPEDKDTAIPQVKGKWRLVVYSAMAPSYSSFPCSTRERAQFPWTTWSPSFGKQSPALFRG